MAMATIYNTHTRNKSRKKNKDSDAIQDKKNERSEYESNDNEPNWNGFIYDFIACLFIFFIGAKLIYFSKLGDFDPSANQSMLNKISSLGKGKKKFDLIDYVFPKSKKPLLNTSILDQMKKKFPGNPSKYKCSDDYRKQNYSASFVEYLRKLFEEGTYEDDCAESNEDNALQKWYDNSTNQVYKQIFCSLRRILDIFKDKENKWDQFAMLFAALFVIVCRTKPLVILIILWVLLIGSFLFRTAEINPTDDFIAILIALFSFPLLFIILCPILAIFMFFKTLFAFCWSGEFAQFGAEIIRCNIVRYGISFVVLLCISLYRNNLVRPF